MGSWSDGSALIAGEKAAESGRSSGQSGDAARSSPCDIVLLPLPAMCTVDAGELSKMGSMGRFTDLA